MANRYFERASDNAELYGRLTIEGIPDPTTEDIDIPLGREVQYPIVAQAEAYLRNPYWFGTSDIKLYSLVSARPPTTEDVTNNMWISAGSLIPNATSGAAIGVYEFVTNDINMEYAAFDGSSVEYAEFSVVMPEKWDGGTIKAKFHWMLHDAPAGGTLIEWGISAGSKADAGAADAALGSAVIIGDTYNLSLDTIHITSYTPDITVGGTIASGNLINFKISRNVLSASDDIIGDAWLLGVYLQYTEHETIVTETTFNIYESDNLSQTSVTPYGSGIIFADFRTAGIVYTGASKTISDRTWSLHGTSDDICSQVIFNVPIAVADGGGGKDLYLLWSENESIFGDVFAIIKKSKSKFSDGVTAAGTSTANWTDRSPVAAPKTYYYLGNTNTSWPDSIAVDKIQPIVFISTSLPGPASIGNPEVFWVAFGLSIVSIHDYSLYHEDDGDLFLEFKSSLSDDTDLTVVLIRADQPRMLIEDSSQILPATTTPAFAGGIQLKQENIPYNRIELIYRAQ